LITFCFRRDGYQALENVKHVRKLTRIRITDHTLVRLKFELKLHKLPKAKAKHCFDFSQKKCQLELRNRFELFDIPEVADPGSRESAESEWERLKVAVTKVATKTLAKKKSTVKNEWITPETFALIEEKRNCHLTSTKSLEYQTCSQRLMT